jgi:diacylglycerol kinase family enzyme
MKIALVINPGSGRKFHADQITEIKSKVLINHDLTEFIAEVDSELDVVGNSIKDGYDMVVVCGGDGTVSRIANCLINKSTPLLVIPIGEKLI